MSLRLGSACADGRPTKGVGEILGSNGVKQLGGRRNTEVDHLTEKTPSDTKTLRDVAGAVELWIHDETLPPHRGARLFKVAPHREQQALLELGGQAAETFGIFPARVLVVNGTRPNHAEETFVGALNDTVKLFAGVRHEPLLLGTAWDFLAKLERSRQRIR